MVLKLDQIMKEDLPYTNFQINRTSLHHFPQNPFQINNL